MIDEHRPYQSRAEARRAREARENAASRRKRGRRITIAAVAVVAVAGAGYVAKGLLVDDAPPDYASGESGPEVVIVVNSGDNLAHVDAVPPLLRAMEPLMEFPGAFVLGSNDRFAPVVKNPALYLTDRYAETPRKRRGDLPVGRLVEGLREGGWFQSKMPLKHARPGTQRSGPQGLSSAPQACMVWMHQKISVISVLSPRGRSGSVSTSVYMFLLRRWTQSSRRS